MLDADRELKRHTSGSYLIDRMLSADALCQSAMPGSNDALEQGQELESQAVRAPADTQNC